MADKDIEQLVLQALLIGATVAVSFGQLRASQNLSQIPLSRLSEVTMRMLYKGVLILTPDMKLKKAEPSA